MSTGAKQSNQTPPMGPQSGGGNVVGKAPNNNTLHQPPNFMGRSGQPDNQSTNRGKGRT